MKLFKEKSVLKRTTRSEKAGKEAFNALDRLNTDLQQKSVEDVSDELFKAIKRFFADYFTMSYEFTHDEFIKDIQKKKGVDDKTKEHLIAFSEHLSDLKYSHKELDKDQVKNLITDFGTIVGVLVDKKKNKSVYEQTRRLTEYVNFALQKGKSKDEVEKSLIDAGWPASIVRRELDKLE